ncbi:hypothetical protein, partial [Bacillus amyloliquefaciens]|uniref:hypothetical protein n=1 Tax=Bacillus amyloliquefaciens TaxID=1390 RepID=UPI00197B044F
SAQELFNGFLSFSIQGIVEKPAKIEARGTSIKAKINETNSYLEHMGWQLKIQFSHSRYVEEADKAMFLKNKWIEEDDLRMNNYRKFYQIYNPEGSNENNKCS